ncbi:glycosyltransferase [Phormidium sp. LEGE 05292]|uniref:hormogonium polysaccharide biosynthesis glycosyltransferase HpsE n=1 Tax=[Phormidium] sp. LEGE 05292 TaxID=767427 RepID=UPI001880C0AC|nr:hormogonium polysaccharide biosynthesis glycosyltransferase HpsE [Phormidium sp. LEGE 05292]MBE9228373.1 glycosyltransferase [Phormidium sp. LEGE 05292]
MPDFTVAIPTYNGEHRLPEVLEKLRSQIYTESLNWEILVIDNNSTDNTAKVVEDYQQNWSENFPLRYCQEQRQGAGFARQKAIKEAKSELIGFLDDDNLPAENWLTAAYTFSKKYPKAGAFGSQIHPIYEVEPPENFQKIAPFLAITERGENPILYYPSSKLLPPSAGLVVRKQAWLENVPNQLILTGRTNGKMLTSEDLEVLSHIQQSNWEIWYNPAMEIYHKIPSWRLERSYLISLIQGIGLSRHVTRTIGVKPWQKPLVIPAYMANDLRKIILHILKYRTKVNTDLIAACEMQLYVSSLISPFFIYKKMYFGS